MNKFEKLSKNLENIDTKNLDKIDIPLKRGKGEKRRFSLLGIYAFLIYLFLLFL